jgi:hypothetical protein
MRISMWFCVVGIAVAATGCSDGRNMGGPNTGTSQTHTVNRPVDDNSRTGSGATPNSAPTGSGTGGTSAPANSGSGETGTGGSGTGGTGGTAPSGK